MKHSNHDRLSDNEFREVVINALEFKSMKEWLVPGLLAVLITLLGFFGAKWIQAVEANGEKTLAKVEIVETSHNKTINRVEVLEKEQIGLADRLKEVSFKVDQQALDVRSISGNIVKVETKLDFLVEREKRK